MNLILHDMSIKMKLIENKIDMSIPYPRYYHEYEKFPKVS